MQIRHFGLHRADGDIWFLVQGNGAVNLISNELRSPFVVKRTGWDRNCPHSIDLDDTVELPPWVSHPTVRFFAPTPRVPGQKPRLLYDPTGQYEAQILALTQLSSPIRPVLQPLWINHQGQSRRVRYDMTNLGTIVWVGAIQSDVKVVIFHANLSITYNRKMLVISRDYLPLFDYLDPLEMNDLPDLTKEPMRQIGAQLLKDYMNG